MALKKMKINWAVEDAKRHLESKGYEFQYTLGSINYTCYVYKSKRNGRRIDIWDDKSGELIVVDVNNRSVNLQEI